MLVTRVGAAVVIGPVSGYNEASIRIRDGGSFRGATHVRTDAVRAHFEAVANGGHPSVLGCFWPRRIYGIYARPKRVGARLAGPFTDAVPRRLAPSRLAAVAVRPTTRPGRRRLELEAHPRFAAPRTSRS